VFREDEPVPSAYVVLSDIYTETDGGHRMPTVDMAVRSLREGAADVGAEGVVEVVGGLVSAAESSFSWASGLAVVFDETGSAQDPLESSVTILPFRNQPEGDESQKSEDESLLLSRVRLLLEKQGYQTLPPSRAMSDRRAAESGDQVPSPLEYRAHLLLDFTIAAIQENNVLLGAGATAVVRAALREAESGEVIWEQEATASSPAGLLAIGVDHRGYALILAANEVFMTLPAAPGFVCPAD
jgi:hypothetical protein